LASERSSNNSKFNHRAAARPCNWPRSRLIFFCAQIHRTRCQFHSSDYSKVCSVETFSAARIRSGGRELNLSISAIYI
jgi:hypothetical protein